MDNNFSPELVAERLGYPLPVSAFGLVRWESPAGLPDYAVATADGEGVFLVEIFQRAGDNNQDVRLARLQVPFDGSSFDGFIFGHDPKDIPGPEFVIDHLAKIIATMGPPVYMDSDFPSTEPENEH